MTPGRHWWRPAPGIVRASLVGALASLCGIALTATSGWLIVQASTRPVILTLLTAIVAVRAFGIGRPVLRYAERILAHDAALADLVRRRTTTYRRLIPLTPVGLGRRRRGDLMAGIVHDLDDEVDTQVRALVPLLGCGIATIVCVTIGWALHPPTAGILAALVAVCAGAAAACGRWEARAAARATSARAAVQEATTLAAADATSVRAIGAVDDVVARLESAHRTLRSAIRAQSRPQAVGAWLTPTLIGAATAAVAAPLHTAVTSGALSAPIAAMLLLLPVAFTDVLTTVPEAVQALVRGRAAHARTESLLTQDVPAIAGGARPVPPRAPVIELTRVSAGWRTGRRDLPETSLRIRPGEHVAVVGPNGAGKSTLLAVLARQLAPSRGGYHLDGHAVDGVDPDAVRSLFAVVDDEPHVFAGTVRANLVLARPDADDDSVRSALDRAGLAAWLRSLPDGLDTLLGQGHRDVSGGERARLSLARALLSDRPVMLLDEPVAHLDHPTATRVMADMMTAASGRTVVAVSHQAEGLHDCDRVLPLGEQPATFEADGPRVTVSV